MIFYLLCYFSLDFCLAHWIMMELSRADLFIAFSQWLLDFSDLLSRVNCLFSLSHPLVISFMQFGEKYNFFRNTSDSTALMSKFIKQKGASKYSLPGMVLLLVATISLISGTIILMLQVSYCLAFIYSLIVGDENSWICHFHTDIYFLWSYIFRRID